MFKVTKRDGRPADFELAKIKKAVTGAFLETKTPFDDDIIMNRRPASRRPSLSG